jgi:hypothetical protein
VKNPTAITVTPAPVVIFHAVVAAALISRLYTPTVVLAGMDATVVAPSNTLTVDDAAVFTVTTIRWR